MSRLRGLSPVLTPPPLHALSGLSAVTVAVASMIAVSTQLSHAQSAVDEDTFEVRIASRGRRSHSCRSELASCRIEGRWRRGTYTLDTRWRDTHWSARLPFEGHERRLEVTVRDGGPVVVLEGGEHPRLRLSLATERDALALLPGRRSIQVFLRNDSATAVTASADIERWNGTDWANPDLFGMSQFVGHGSFWPEPVTISPGERRVLPMLYERVPIDRDTRYRLSATTRREERIEPFDVVRTSRNELIVMGSEVVLD